MSLPAIGVLDGPFEALTGLALLVACLAAAHPLAALLTQRARISHRWCATAVVASWLLTLLFHTLAACSAFRLPVVAFTLILLGVGMQLTVARRPEVRGLLESDFRSAFRRLRHPPGALLSVAGLAVIALLAIRLAKGLVSPPLAWDALTYHLLKAGRWVQSGGWVHETAPDAWSYYEHFPPGGDLFWAYAMLPGRSDALIPVAGLLVLLVCAVAAYGASRALECPVRGAMGAALAIVAMPCISAFIASAYVTTLLVAELLLALTFIVLVVRSGRFCDALLAAAALGLAAGVQAVGLPLLAVGMTAVTTATWRHSKSSSLWWVAPLLLVVSVPGLLGYALTWGRTGSPVYPLTLAIGGHTIWSGNEQLEGILSGTYLGVQSSQDSLSSFALALFQTRVTDPFHGVVVDHLNLGAGAILLIGTGLVGLWHSARKGRADTLVLLAFAAVPVGAILSDGLLSQRTAFSWVAGRFVAPSVAALAVAAGTVPSRGANWAREAAVLLGVAYALPKGLSHVEQAAVNHLVPSVIAAIALAVLIAGFGWSVRRAGIGATAGALAALAVASVGLHSTRATFRYQIYRAAAGEAPTVPYDLHPLPPPLVAWRIWQTLDDGSPYRIAFAAAWDGYAGHTWYRYPLMGSRLQNTVLYIPPTRDGKVVDYRRKDLLLPKADFRAWLRRLIEERIDVVVMGPPDTPELKWMREHPSAFVPMVPTHEQGFATYAFRIDTPAAQLLLQ